MYLIRELVKISNRHKAFFKELERGKIGGRFINMVCTSLQIPLTVSTTLLSERRRDRNAEYKTGKLPKRS